MKEEVWKDIEGYYGLYQISNLGRCKRLAGKGCNKERILKPQNGRYELCKDCDRAMYAIDYLVAAYFLEKPKRCIDKLIHIDGNKDNNCADNLMWKGAKTVESKPTPKTNNQPEDTKTDLHSMLLEVVTKAVNNIDLLKLNDDIPMKDKSIVIKDLCNTAFKYIIVNPVSANKWLMKNGIVYDDNNVKVPTIPYKKYYTEKTFKRDEFGGREFHYYAVNSAGLSFIIDTIAEGIKCGEVQTKIREDKIKVKIEIED